MPATPSNGRRWSPPRPGPTLPSGRFHLGTGGRLHIGMPSLLRLCQHLGRRQIGFELRIEVTNQLASFVSVILLHPIIDSDRTSHIAAGSEIDDGQVDWTLP